jgi:hypothetical protein
LEYWRIFCFPARGYTISGSENLTAASKDLVLYQPDSPQRCKKQSRAY